MGIDQLHNILQALKANVPFSCKDELYSVAKVSHSDTAGFLSLREMPLLLLNEISVALSSSIVSCLAVLFENAGCTRLLNSAFVQPSFEKFVAYNYLVWKERSKNFSDMLCIENQLVDLLEVGCDLLPALLKVGIQVEPALFSVLSIAVKSCQASEFVIACGKTKEFVDLGELLLASKVELMPAVDPITAVHVQLGDATIVDHGLVGCGAAILRLINDIGARDRDHLAIVRVLNRHTEQLASEQCVSELMKNILRISKLMDFRVRLGYVEMLKTAFYSITKEERYRCMDFYFQTFGVIDISEACDKAKFERELQECMNKLVVKGGSPQKPEDSDGVSSKQSISLPEELAWFALINGKYLTMQLLKQAALAPKLGPIIAEACMFLKPALLSDVDTPSGKVQLLTGALKRLFNGSWARPKESETLTTLCLSLIKAGILDVGLFLREAVWPNLMQNESIERAIDLAKTFIAVMSALQSKKLRESVIWLNEKIEKKKHDHWENAADEEGELAEPNLPMTSHQNGVISSAKSAAENSVGLFPVIWFEAFATLLKKVSAEDVILKLMKPAFDLQTLLLECVKCFVDVLCAAGFKLNYSSVPVALQPLAEFWPADVYFRAELSKIVDTPLTFNVPSCLKIATGFVSNNEVIFEQGMCSHDQTNIAICDCALKHMIEAVCIADTAIPLIFDNWKPDNGFFASPELHSSLSTQISKVLALSIPTQRFDAWRWVFRFVSNFTAHVPIELEPKYTHSQSDKNAISVEALSLIRGFLLFQAALQLKFSACEEVLPSAFFHHMIVCFTRLCKEEVLDKLSEFVASDLVAIVVEMFCGFVDLLKFISACTWYSRSEDGSQITTIQLVCLERVEPHRELLSSSKSVQCLSDCLNLFEGTSMDAKVKEMASKLITAA